MHSRECQSSDWWLLNSNKWKQAIWAIISEFMSACVSLCTAVNSPFSNPRDNVSQKMFINNWQGPREGNNWHSYLVTPISYPSPGRNPVMGITGSGEGIRLQVHHSVQVSTCIVFILSHNSPLLQRQFIDNTCAIYINEYPV